MTKRADSTGRGAEPVSLADAEGVRQIVAEAVLGLWDVVNNLTRLKLARSDRYRVSIFGSARVQPGEFAYVETRRLAAALAAMDCDIVTGGGPGLMQAANEGAVTVPGASKSVGIRIALPFEQDVNAFVTQAFEHRTFFTRLHQFVLTSDVFVVAPGGIGTVLETMMVWQLLQVGHIRDTPLIMVGKMWPGLVDWARSAMLGAERPLANPEDIDIPLCVANADEALAIIREHHERWKKAR